MEDRFKEFNDKDFDVEEIEFLKLEEYIDCYGVPDWLHYNDNPTSDIIDGDYECTYVFSYDNGEVIAGGVFFESENWWESTLFVDYFKVKYTRHKIGYQCIRHLLQYYTLTGYPTIEAAPFWDYMGAKYEEGKEGRIFKLYSPDED